MSQKKGKPPSISSSNQRLPGRRHVSAHLVFHSEEEMLAGVGDVVIDIRRPISKKDWRDGEPVPAAKAVRLRNILTTLIRLSPEAAVALHRALGEILAYRAESDSYTIMKALED